MKITPDWVCEGLSPSTARRDRGRKREIYGEHGVGHIWFVDPRDQTIEVLELARPIFRVVQSVGGDDKLVIAPFSHVIHLAKLWES